MHLVAALHAEQACHQPDRPGTGDQCPGSQEEPPARDLIDLVPRLGQYRGGLQQNPELAILILKYDALESTLKDRATLILDPRTPPFDLLVNPEPEPAAPLPPPMATPTAANTLPRP